MKKFYDELTEILEVDEATREQVLSECDGWDSLGVLSTQVMIEENYGVKISNDEMNSLSTVGDIEDLINSKRSAH